MKRPTFVLYFILDQRRHCGAFIHKACILPLQYIHYLTDSYLLAWFCSCFKLCFFCQLERKGLPELKQNCRLKTATKTITIVKVKERKYQENAVEIQSTTCSTVCLIYITLPHPPHPPTYPPPPAVRITSQ